MLGPHACRQQLAQVHPGTQTHSRNPTEGIERSRFASKLLLEVRGLYCRQVTYLRHREYLVQGHAANEW